MDPWRFHYSRGYFAMAPRGCMRHIPAVRFLLRRMNNGCLLRLYITCSYHSCILLFLPRSSHIPAFRLRLSGVERV
jgi:hypothetical protein